MFRLHHLGVRKIGHGASHLQGAIESAPRERQRLDGPGEQLLGRRGEADLASCHRPGQMGVARHAGRSISCDLPVACGLDALADDLGRLGRLPAEQLAPREPGYPQTQIDPVEQGPGEFRSVLLDAMLGTHAVSS